MVEIQLVLHSLKDARDVLKESLKKRKEMTIQQGDTQYQELDIVGLFDEGNSSEYDEAIVDLMEKNNALNEEVRNLKREHEIKLVRLCKETKQRKKDEEDRVMINED